ncbi:hypothetical protein FRB98_006329 [Tulasnella sp. 332]|nr:hypothetical protein FRB98_006329 [Tulasnella sp. 332]
MLASFSQFIRETGNSIAKPAGALFSESLVECQQQPVAEKDKSLSSPDTDIASATTSVNGDVDGTASEERRSAIADDAESRAAERRRKRSNMVHETFIVVRPPPSVSNHPLNLQLQLVPPSTREQARQVSSSTTASAVSNRTSESVNTQDPNSNPTRERRPSLRSNRSATSLYSTASANSTTFSFASTSSNVGPSVARRIIPLYNLSAHNVMTNTITDAGTDAKVAKFGKKGIEVINLGVLECFEVYGVVLTDPGLFMDTRLRRTESKGGWLHARKEADTGSSIRDHASERSGPPSISERQQAPPSISEEQGTPSSSTSHLHIDKSDHMTTPTASAASMSNQPSTPTPSSAKKIFGKMFKRKETNVTPNTTPTTPRILGAGPSTPTPTTPTPASMPMSPSTSIFARKQRQQPSSSSQQQHEPTIQEDPLDMLGAAGTLQPPCLGTQATLLHRETDGGRYVPAGAITALNNAAAGARASLHKSRSKGSLADDMTAGRQSIDSTLHPVISTPSSPPNIGLSSVPVGYRKTSHSYEWVIRKWIKGADHGLFGIKDGLMSAKSAVFNTSVTAAGDSRMEVEVRFEWVKGKGSAARARDKIARLRLTGGREDDDGASRTEGRRERPKSLFAGGSEAGGSGSRPNSMFIPSATSLQLDGGAATIDLTNPNLGAKLKKTRQSPSKNNTYSNQLVRSPSPTRPSLESRRSSDESAENRSANATAASIADHTSTVYKGKKRRTSNAAKDKESPLLGLGLGQPGGIAGLGGGGDDAATLFGGGDDGLGTGGKAVDNPDSDPEDSETPWTCTLYVGPPVSKDVLPDPFHPLPASSIAEEKRRPSTAGVSVSGSRSAFVLGSASPDASGHARYATSASAHQFPTTASKHASLLSVNGGGGGGHRKVATATGAEQPEKEEKKGIRIKLGTLTPAPYHPKVVSQLRMPFPLPDVNVRRMEIVKPGDAIDGSTKGGDLILTMEEIKDVVCVTGLWLVVREGFGGLERRRKGDGWKIRG